jgi:pyruvate dehydrogenase E2 component (dihydrolipoamide acetyltransferase)
VSEPAPKPAFDLLPWPEVDFAAFGAVESKPLLRIQQIVGKTLSRNWVMIPNVTHQEEADITEFDVARFCWTVAGSPGEFAQAK